jgi:hypothetical protein
VSPSLSKAAIDSEEAQRLSKLSAEMTGVDALASA